MLGQAERLFELKRLQDNITKSKSQKIFAFTSGKGGTGKTFLSLNLAYSLAEEGSKVLFIDLDSNLSNANIMLNVVAIKTLYDFITEKKLLKDVITVFNPNLHFVFGDSGKLNYPEAQENIISKLYNQLISLQKNYDFIFLDTGSGAGSDIVNILLRADSVILVSSPEPTSVMDSYVMLKLLNASNYPGDKLIIVNKNIEQDDGQVTFNNLSTAAGHFLKESLIHLGSVQFDVMASRTIMNQELVVEKYPETMLSSQIRSIGKSISEFAHMANIHQE